MILVWYVIFYDFASQEEQMKLSGNVFEAFFIITPARFVFSIYPAALGKHQEQNLQKLRNKI